MSSRVRRNWRPSTCATTAKQDASDAHASERSASWLAGRPAKNGQEPCSGRQAPKIFDRVSGVSVENATRWAARGAPRSSSKPRACENNPATDLKPIIARGRPHGCAHAVRVRMFLPPRDKTVLAGNARVWPLPCRQLTACRPDAPLGFSKFGPCIDWNEPLQPRAC